MNEKTKPLSWPQIIVGILPGLFFLILNLFGNLGLNQLIWNAVYVALVALPFLAAVALAIRQRSVDAYPAWGLLPAGFLIFIPVAFDPSPESYALIAILLLAAALLPALKGRRPAGFPTIPRSVLALLALSALVLLVQGYFLGGFKWYRYSLFDLSWLGVPLAAGFLLARVHGLRAALILLPAGFFMASFEIEHAIYFWEARAWSDFLSLSAAFLAWVLTPLLVLRARSISGQVAGLLLPLLAYHALLVFALAQVSFVADEGLFRQLSIAEPLMRLLLLISLVAALYTWRQEAAPPALEPLLSELPASA